MSLGGTSELQVPEKVARLRDHHKTGSAWIAAALLVSACGTPGPQPIHLNGLPNDQTAVIGNADYSKGTIFVHAVNGNKTSCVTLGCPRVVRIAAGPAVVQVSFALPHGTSIDKTAKLVDLDAFEAKPGHTYLLQCEVVNDQDRRSVRIWVEDRGLNQPIPKDLIPGL